MDVEIVVVSDEEALAREAARRLTALARHAVSSRGRASVVLSGGSTPRRFFALLAKEPYRSQIPWEQVHLFWADERCVPPDDAGSNYRMANEILISQVSIPSDHVHRMLGELAPDVAAQAYERELEDFFCGPRPRFDLVLLGVGEDGHTASLFPNSPLLAESERLVAPATASYQDRPARRITLTLPAINTARQVLFLVSGSAKSRIVASVLKDPGGHLPAQSIRPNAGSLGWLMDAAAAAGLPSQHHGDG
jgi:6-phosphogluconolactonase